MNAPSLRPTLMLAALSLWGCIGDAPPKPGPINLDYLWRSWETTGWHVDLRDRPGAIIVERYHIDSTAFENPGIGPKYHISRKCDAYLCKNAKTDTCYRYQSFGGIIEPDSVLDFTLFTVHDKRPIFRLTESSLVYMNGSMKTEFKPSQRVLVDSLTPGMRD